MDSDRTSGWQMETHNIALTALNKIEMHGEECTRRQMSIDRAHSEIKQSIKDLENGTESSVNDIKADVKKINIRLAMFLGGFYILMRLVEWGFISPHIAKSVVMP